MPDPLRIAFLGCGFITRVHSRIARAVDGWEAPTQARGGVEFFMERLVRPSEEYALGVQ